MKPPGGRHWKAFSESCASLVQTIMMFNVLITVPVMWVYAVAAQEPCGLPCPVGVGDVAVHPN